jgi:glutathione S-transferase
MSRLFVQNTLFVILDENFIIDHKYKQIKNKINFNIDNNGKINSKNYRYFLESIIHKNVILIGTNHYIENLLNKYVKWFHYDKSIEISEEKIPQLYYINGSVSSWRIILYFNYLNLPFEAIRLKIMRKNPQTRTKEYLNLNPRGKAPLLIDTNNNKIYESLAILLHLNKTNRLDTELDSQNSVMIQRMIETENLIHKYEKYEKYIFADQIYQNNKDLTKIINSIDKELTIWDKYLDNSRYLVNENITLADITFYPIIHYMIHRGYKIKFNNILKYFNNMRIETFSYYSKPLFWK